MALHGIPILEEGDGEEEGVDECEKERQGVIGPMVMRFGKD